jgi:GNAT superfamily N-acetyltransferase
MPDYAIRRAGIDDIAIIARHRVAMFRDMGQLPTEAMAAELLAQSTPALAAALRDGSYVGWLAVATNGEIVAGAGMHIKPQLPRPAPDHASVATSPVPLVLNVYTEPAWRRRGLARALMTTLMQWAKAEGCDRVVLHASPDGRALYEALGFVPTNEMRWIPR